MQRRKIVIATLSLLLVGLALPTANINKAHAFTTGNNSLIIGNTYSGPSLPPGIASGTIVQGGSSITVNAAIAGSLFNNPAYQRNVTVGFKGDWQLYYQNSSITTITTGQIASISFSVPIPSASAPNTAHTYTIEIWDGPSSGFVSGCNVGDAENNFGASFTKSCFALGAGSFSILSADQYSAAQARNAASLAITAGGALSDETALAQRAQATAERTLGDTSWSTGDYSGAKSHYQNSQNDANAALTTQVNIGGGSSNAGIVGAIESGTGILLFGLGGLLAGFGGFMYLRRKPKA